MKDINADILKKSLETFAARVKNINPISFNFCLKVPGIRKVIFNDPYTIVLWEDNTKTIVKCQKCIGYEGWVESFDPEKGLAMAISKKALGNTGNYYEVFKHFIPQELNSTWTTTINGKDPGDLNFGDTHKKLKDFSDKVSKDILSPKLKNYAYPNYDQIKDEDLEAGFYDRNKYGDIFDKRFYYAGKRHKIVCAGTCYHVKNIKKENAIVYATRYDAIKDGCVLCKHCSGVSIFSELHRIGYSIYETFHTIGTGFIKFLRWRMYTKNIFKGCLELHKKIKEDKDN